MNKRLMLQSQISFHNAPTSMLTRMYGFKDLQQMVRKCGGREIEPTTTKRVPRLRWRTEEAMITRIFVCFCYDPGWSIPSIFTTLPISSDAISPALLEQKRRLKPGLD